MPEVIYISLTLCVFWAAWCLQRKTGWMVLNPILISIAVIILILKAADIPYQDYEGGSRFIAFLLKPAIVALGVPLYLQLEQIKKQLVPVLVSQLVACIAGIASAVLLAQLLGATPEVAISLAPKSATTPIAMEVSEITGGIPALTAVIVILTGILGAIIGQTVLRLFHVRSRIAQGLALGAAAHAVGTAHATQQSSRLGAYSSLGLILNGTLTGLFTPWILQLLGF